MASCTVSVAASGVVDIRFQGVALRRGGGRRGLVRKFSRASRSRLMRRLGMVSRSSLPYFVTLTYPRKYPSARDSKRHLRAFLERVRRRYPRAGWFWRLEYQRRGAPHYHLLVWGVDDGYREFLAWVASAWYDIAGYGDEYHYLFHIGRLSGRPCVERVMSWRGVVSYASKYLAKVQDEDLQDEDLQDEDLPGRFWGYGGAVPWAAVVSVVVSLRVGFALLRLVRRYSGLPLYRRGCWFFSASPWLWFRAVAFLQGG